MNPENIVIVIPEKHDASCLHAAAKAIRSAGLRLMLALVAAFIAGPDALRAQQDKPATGMIEGRVLNVDTGDYLNLARVSIEGAKLETLTDTFGQYRLANIPAGPVKVRASFMGRADQVLDAIVTPDGTSQLDFNLTALRETVTRKSQDGDVIQLEKFVVESTRETNAAAIALNEQRNAANMLNVISADEFGVIADGNVGEFLKRLPGISLDTDGYSTYVSMEGVHARYVPVTVGGFSVASANTYGERYVELERLSVNNVARFEVVKSPTPESQGSALAGSINLVPRMAFERAKPQFSYKIFTMAAESAMTLGKTPGPFSEEVNRKARPGFNISYINPVNKWFGFTFGAARSYSYVDNSGSQFNYVGTYENPTGNSLARGASPSNPYLRDYYIRDQRMSRENISFSATFDFKLTRRDMLSVGLQWSFSDSDFVRRYLQFSPNSVADAPYGHANNAAYPEGDVGFGEVNGKGWTRGQGSILVVNPSSATDFRQYGTTTMPTLTWRHRGPIWQWEVGAALSKASLHYRDISEGFFERATARLQGNSLFIRYDDIDGPSGPGTISVHGQGSQVPLENRPKFDYLDLNNYFFTGVSSSERDYTGENRMAHAKIDRVFDVLGVPVMTRLGAGYQLTAQDMDPFGMKTWDYTPMGSNNNYNLGQTLDRRRIGMYVDLEDRVLGGSPLPTREQDIMHWPSGRKAYQLFLAHPEDFTTNEITTHQNKVSNTRHVEEGVSHAFLRIDAPFINNRLKVTTGVRMERTDIKSVAGLVDPTLNYKKDSDGNILYGEDGRPLTIDPAGSLARWQRIYVLNGSRAEVGYTHLFPSVNVSFDILQNLVARGAWYTSIGRPGWGTYASTLTFPEATEEGTAGIIKASNPDLKPWTAKTTKFILEYYFPKSAGNLSLEVFQRDYENFFVSALRPVDHTFLSMYGLSDAYLGYDVQQTVNGLHTIRGRGLTIGYRQALRFLPDWARGFSLWGTYSRAYFTGEFETLKNFSGHQPHVANWGASLSRRWFSLSVDWNWRSRRPQNYIYTGNDIRARVYYNEILTMNCSAEIKLGTRGHYILFVQGRDVTGAGAFSGNEVLGEGTPDWARTRSQSSSGGALWTLGIRGAF